MQRRELAVIDSRRIGTAAQEQTGNGRLAALRGHQQRSSLQGVARLDVVSGGDVPLHRGYLASQDLVVDRHRGPRLPALRLHDDTSGTVTRLA
jgi:hypothetical protein